MLCLKAFTKWYPWSSLTTFRKPLHYISPKSSLNLTFRSFGFVNQRRRERYVVVHEERSKEKYGWNKRKREQWKTRYFEPVYYFSVVTRLYINIIYFTYLMFDSILQYILSQRTFGWNLVFLKITTTISLTVTSIIFF